MPKHRSQAASADGDKASARRRNFSIINHFISTHPKAWVNKLCTHEGATVLKEV